MKTELKAKFLQHLNQKKRNEGFTLIELLMVIFIVGILSAIALPTFLNQSGKAKQAEAKQNIGVVNRTQIAHRTENSSFANSFDVLAMGTLKGGADASTSNYLYKISSGAETTTIVATASDTSLKAYSGGNSRNTTVSLDTVINSIICEANTPGSSASLPPDVSSTGAPACKSGYQNLNH